MTARRLVSMIALTALVVFTGCETYCRNHYPCPQVYAAPTAACVPCNPCCAPSGYGPAPAVAPTPAWNAPRAAGTCCPN
jgi:hypothetical protein